jgi:nitroreductase
MKAPESIAYILNRHSCRNFRAAPLRESDLQLLLEAARWAPSAGNVQPWFFYAVLQRNLKLKLAAAALGQDFLAEAAVVFVVCADAQESALTYGERGRTLYCLQDTAAASENLLLAATALGYGSCWVGAFDERAATRVLGIPANLRPVALIAVGPGAPVSDFPGRKPLQRISRILE